MKKVGIFLLIAAFGVVVSGCTSSEPAPSSNPDEPQKQEETTLTEAAAFVGDFLVSSDMVKGLLEKTEENPAALEDFLTEHPDFLLEQFISSNARTYQGENIVFLMPVRSDNPEDYLINHERLHQFAENYKAGKADSIAILSSGSPIPLSILVMSYTGEDKEITLSVITPDKELNRITTAVLEETDTQWIFRKKDGYDITYPRYGYEALKIYESNKEVAPEEAKKLMEDFCREWYSEQQAEFTLEQDISDELQNAENRYAYQVSGTYQIDGQETMLYDSWRVEKDFSSLYNIEQVNGKPCLLVTFKTAPQE